MPPRVDPGALEFAAAMQRRTARLAVNGQVQIAIPAIDVPLELRDLSFGGFAITAPRPFWKGMTHWFTFSTSTFTSGEDRSVTLVAKAVHCHGVPGEEKFVSGWEFMAGTSQRTEKAIGELLDALAMEWGKAPFPHL